VANTIRARKKADKAPRPSPKPPSALVARVRERTFSEVSAFYTVPESGSTVSFTMSLEAQMYVQSLADMALRGTKAIRPKLALKLKPWARETLETMLSRYLSRPSLSRSPRRRVFM
jgi:hypothetical protein